MVIIRWLLKMWELFGGFELVKVLDVEGGFIFVLKSIFIGCGGMRGVLFSGGKCGEEMV